jgi:hypothetical protein
MITSAGAMAMLDPKLEVHTAAHDVLELPGAKTEAGKREAPGFPWGQERAFGRGAGGLGACRPPLPHTRWLATPQWID